MRYGEVMDPLRLYLDTADLADIGDGRDESATVELLALCERLDVLLVVSLWHVVDTRNADEATRRRVFRAVDRFPQRLLARVEDSGLVFMSFQSFEALCDEHADDVKVMDAANNHFVALQESAPPPLQPGWQLNLSKRVLLESVGKASSREEAIEVARAMLYKERRRLPEDRRDQMLAMVNQVWDVRVHLESVGIWSPEVVSEVLTTRDVAAVPDENVGRHIGVLINQRRGRQLDRKPQSGDAADIHHAHFAPYVDIYTGDHDICTWLNEWRSEIPYERDVHPVSNRHMDRVLAILRNAVSAQEA